MEGKRLLYMVDSIAKSGHAGLVVETNSGVGFMLANFTISAGKDEKGTYISYNDVWDLKFVTEDLSDTYGGIGRPIKIYDRIYYDQNTGHFLPQE